MTRYFSVVVNGKRYAVLDDREAAERVAQAKGGKVEEFEFFTPLERIKRKTEVA